LQRLTTCAWAAETDRVVLEVQAVSRDLACCVCCGLPQLLLVPEFQYCSG